MAKNTTNMARTRNQKREASKRYQELNREVKRRCRRDFRELRRLEREVMQGLDGKNKTRQACCSGQQRRRFSLFMLNHEEPINPSELVTWFPWKSASYVP